MDGEWGCCGCRCRILGEMYIAALILGFGRLISMDLSGVKVSHV